MRLLDGIASRLGYVQAAEVSPVLPDPAPRKLAVSESARPRARSATRMYKSAANNRLTQGLPSVPMTADSVSLRTLRVLRARSRYEVANSDIAHRAISLYDTNVIGTGIMLQSRVMDAKGEPDEAVNEAIERNWADWGRSCDVTGELSWWDIQRLFLTSTLTDGEALNREHYGRDAGPWGYALQVVDPELLELEDNRVLANGNFVRMGVEYNAIGRPVAYWIVKPDPRQGHLSYGYTGRRAQRFNAEGVIHRFYRERVGQSRGVPKLATCLLRLAHLEGAEDAALVAFRLGASKLGFFKDDGTGGGGYMGDDQTGVESAAALDLSDPETPFDRIIDADIGSFGELPPGVTVETWDPGYPNNEYAPFQKRLLQNTGSGTDLPYFELGNDLEGVNYSSAKIGQQGFHDTCRAWQKYVVEGLCDRVYRNWLMVQLLMGTIKTSDGRVLTEADYEACLNVRHQSRSWEEVDRLKGVTADALAVESMQDSLTNIIRKRSGREFMDIVKERKREIDAMSSAGIPQAPKLNEQILAMAAATDQEEKKNA